MNPELWTEAKALFFDALGQPPDARRAWLAAACPDNPPLRQEVESLLDAHDAAGSFIETPAAGYDVKVKAVVDAHAKWPVLGIFGEPRVNVLALNRALDALPPG